MVRLKPRRHILAKVCYNWWCALLLFLVLLMLSCQSLVRCVSHHHIWNYVELWLGRLWHHLLLASPTVSLCAVWKLRLRLGWRWQGWLSMHMVAVHRTTVRQLVREIFIAKGVGSWDGMRARLHHHFLLDLFFYQIRSESLRQNIEGRHHG